MNEIKKQECEECEISTNSVKWRVFSKRKLCFTCHCECDTENGHRPSQKIIDYRLLNWKM